MKEKSTERSAFFNTHVLVTLVLSVIGCSIITGTLLGFMRREAQTSVSQRTLTFAERVAYQRAIEDVYWRHRIWPKECPDPKPSLDAVMSHAQLEKKVADYLRKSQALEDYWQRPINAELLQAEMDRMAKHTNQPEVLRELFAALGNDPLVIAECLARPALADRLLTNWYAYDQRIHGELKQRAEAELQASRGRGIEQMKQTNGNYSEIELVKDDSGETVGQAHRLPNGQLAGGPPALQRQNSTRIVKLNGREWDETVQRLAATFNQPRSRLFNGRGGLPSRPPVPVRPHHGEQAVVAPYQTLPTGTMSSLQEDETCYQVTVVMEKTHDYIKLATVAWPKEPLDAWLARAQSQVPNAIATPTASYALPEILEGTGCVDNTWTATAGPADPRHSHTAVWTGSEMIVWGGQSGFSSYLSSGGKYNPSTDTWVATAAAGAPTPRVDHTAVWTGSEMIVWGGLDENFFRLDTGGKYDPSTNSWTPTSHHQRT